MAWVAVLAAGFIAGSGCGGGSGPPAHPDTGFGAGETVPATPNCVDLCLRDVDCGVALCNEDTMSTRYTALADLLASQCLAACSAVPAVNVTQAQWQCLFQSSCRQVFEIDVCHAAAHYSCSGETPASDGTYASALGSCTAYCETYFAACSPPAYPTDGQCKISLCSPIPSTASADCYSATKRWYDCRKAQADLCGDSGCADQAAAAQSACP